MEKVIIWGTGKTYVSFRCILRDDIEIAAFVETEPEKDSFEGKPVLSPNELTKVKYDYIVVFSIYVDSIFDVIRKNNIGGKVILYNQHEEYFDFMKDPFHKKLNKLNDRQGREAEVLITGLSYHDDGIKAACFKRPAVNMAMGSQDLFYDFEVAKYVIGKIGGGGKVLYSRTGIFQYGI